MQKKFLIPFTIILFASVCLLAIKFATTPDTEDKSENNHPLPASLYRVNPDFNFSLNKLAENMGFITRIKIMPDKKWLLVANLQGSLSALFRNAEGWHRQNRPVFTVDMNLPENNSGFPSEHGMTGLIVSADFARSHEVFLTYVRLLKETQEYLNEIVRIKLHTQIEDGHEILYGDEAKIIFTGNTPALRSHQIQGGLSLILGGETHILFSIGDATEPAYSQDEQREVGKIMLLTREGKAPYSSEGRAINTKIQALGLRNAWDVAISPADGIQRLAIGDTGPELNDRLIYGDILGSFNVAGKPLNFHWQGLPQELALPVLSTTEEPAKNLVIKVWPEQMTPTDLCFYPGGVAGVPAKKPNIEYLLISFWGQYAGTGGRKLSLATIDSQGNSPQVTDIHDIVTRSDPTSLEPGTLLGMTCDSESGEIFFGDFFHGDLYQLLPQS